MFNPTIFHHIFWIADDLAGQSYWEAVQCGDAWENRPFPFSFGLSCICSILWNIPSAVSMAVEEDK